MAATRERAAAAPVASPERAGSSASAFVVMAALLVVAPFVVYPVFLMKALCFALFACAFNLLIGYVGLLSFGHAVFLGTAGYVCRARREGVGLAAGARDPRRHRRVGACSGSSSALLAIRRQGIYFAMITLALAQMVFFFCLQAPFTDGEDGIQAVPRGKLLRRSRPRRTCTRCTSSCSRSSSAGSCSSTASSTRRSARC